MIGVVVCTHHTLAEALVQTVTQIVGTFEQLSAVAVEYGDPADQTLDNIRDAIREVDTGDGVVLLEDIATSGGQAIEAARDLEAAGAKVLLILVMVDRLQGAREAVEAAGFAFSSLFDVRDLGIDPEEG